MVEKVDETQVTWFRGLKGTDRQTMRERAALLDRLSATERPDRSVRLALFVGEAEEALAETATLAYTLAAAGQVIWLYTSGALPAEVPADFHERVRHINPDPDRPLMEQVPPVDLFLTPDPGLLAMFYRAERTLLYWHRPGTALPDGWAALPARILTAGAAGTTLDGRRVFPVAPGAEGWAIALAAALKVATKDPLRARRPRLSLCMIVKNEERYLQNCLLSVYGVVDEICIVDTGSSDQTVAIAERLGARVEHRVWRDDFAWARNESLAMATGDWVLHLDADEVLTQEARTEVLQLIRQGGFEGFLLPLDSTTPTGISRSHGLRLFLRNPQVRYVGRIHEQVGEGITRMGGKVYAAASPILHYGYTEDPLRATGKRDRNRSLLLQAVAENPESGWFRYYLAVEENLAGRPDEALRLLQEVPLTPSWIEAEPAALAITCHQHLGQMRSALAVAQTAVLTHPHALGLWVAQATLGYGLGEMDVVVAALDVLTNPATAGLGDRTQVGRYVSFFRGVMATEPAERESQLQQALPLPNAARALIRHWVRTAGLREAIRRTAALGIPDGFAFLLQALVDLQEWNHVQSVLAARPELAETPAAGAFFLAQGRPEEALHYWQKGSLEGWRRYAATVALMGGRQLAAAAEPYLTPLEWLSVQDVLAGAVTWRWSLLVGPVCNTGNPHLLEEFVARAPFLAEVITVHMQLNVLP
ncbi:MAG TPA: glycosyltransferase family 2 protein [Symbiobacteriaceae bacterium]|nr:glycosyltransferase family 2 protein [Symbiobacteriaceae bacterium]